MTTCTKNEIAYRVITGQYGYINGDWYWVYNRSSRYPLAEPEIIPDTDSTSHWGFWLDNYEHLDHRWGEK